MDFIVYVTLQQVRNGCGRYLQFGECEHLFAKVFQRGSDVVHIRIIYNQKTVMAFFVCVYLYRRVLAVVSIQVQLKLAAYSLRVNVGFHSVIPFTEHQQHGFIYIVVYQQKGFLCRPYQVGGELVGIEQLTIVEDALYRWQRSANEEIYLLGMFCNSMLQFAQTTVDGIAL